MFYLRLPTRPRSRSSMAERHLGLIAAVAGAVGVIAICGSPAALWVYAADLATAIWAGVAALIG